MNKNTSGEDLGVAMKDLFSKLSRNTKTAAKSASKVLSKAQDTVVKTTKTVATSILDQDGDGKVDQSDVKILTEKGVKLSKAAAVKSGELIKEASKSSLAKDAAAGAAIGAAIGVPLPIVGPVTGSVVGAGLGVYKNMTGKGTPSYAPQATQEDKKDIYAEILKLGDLKERGLITEEEFEQQKKSLLNEKNS
jgi:hypothetical protein